MAEPAVADEPDRTFANREEESLFARGEDDALIRYVKPTLAQFEEKVTLIIDGEPITVPKAKPRTDALGNPLRRPDGTLDPRPTTIYDAALELVAKGVFTPEELHQRIPVLCHLKHLDPIAVCRMCSVHISSIKRGEFKAGRKLVPACQHRVEDKMAVMTRQGPRDIADFIKKLASEFKVKDDDLPKEKSVQDYSKQVQDSTRFLGELLVADHLHRDSARGNRYINELQTVAQIVDVPDRPRFTRNPGGLEGRNRELHPRSRPIPLEVIKESPGTKKNSPDAEFRPEPLFPYSSRTIHVDHDRCILCDRCARSCSDVKPFKIIGHTGKGYNTRISFDLDQLMNDSGCVQCGECMTSCPTGALTMNRRVSPTSWADNVKIPTDPDAKLPDGFLTAEQMLNEVSLNYEQDGKIRSFNPFRDISFPFLRWNEGAVRLRTLQPGDVLCNQGEFGSTAYLLVKGDFKGEQVFEVAEPEDKAKGFWSWFGGKNSAAKTKRKAEFTISATRDLITGELACLTNDRRTATLVADTPAEVIEVTRNVLAMLQRSPSARKVLDTIYRRRAILTSLRKSERFKSLSERQRNSLLSVFERESKMVRVEPGEVIIEEGDQVGFGEDGKTFHGDLYIIHMGFVKVSKLIDGQERVISHLGKGDHFGEIALLPDHPMVKKAGREMGINPSQRTATCTALADVEVVSIPGRAFREFFRYEPDAGSKDEFSRIADNIAKECVARLTEQREPPLIERDREGDFLRQGLYQGQKMLVLDLKTCTRCDECTKACADAHGDGHSRLLREGLRFGDFLVAASCRSCHQPYCMDGCPVDAIHRKENALEIRIDNHCIGCGLCEKNCPYASIQMVARAGGGVDELGKPLMTAQVARKAVNCDLCHGLIKPGQDPFCVNACPHEAAFRWSGEELMAEMKLRDR
ncbi:MAG: cyclic nucleotide-binding domain-containing protein [Planctomycetes bacterium]|nr:cyclic nucleotide-binding domain-containing protein [Planctomycetota bacterium]